MIGREQGPAACLRIHENEAVTVCGMRQDDRTAIGAEAGHVAEAEIAVEQARFGAVGVHKGDAADAVVDGVDNLPAIGGKDAAERVAAELVLGREVLLLGPIGPATPNVPPAFGLELVAEPSAIGTVD